MQVVVHCTAPGATVAPPRYEDVFVRDMVEGETILVGQSNRGRAGDRDSDEATMSEDGSTVVFSSAAKKLVPEVEHRERHIYRRDFVTGTISLVAGHRPVRPGDAVDDARQPRRGRTQHPRQ